MEWMLATEAKNGNKIPRVAWVTKTLCIPYMRLYLHSVIKPSKSMGTWESCMGIGNLSVLTLENTGGLGMF